MNDIKVYNSFIRIVILLTYVFLLVYGDRALFSYAATIVLVIMLARALTLSSRKVFKFLLIIIYIVIYISYIYFYSIIDFGKEFVLANGLLRNTVCAIILLLPYIIERVVTIKMNPNFYLPSSSELKTIYFEELNNLISMASKKTNRLNAAAKCISPSNLSEIIEDLPRHSSSSYINRKSLSTEFFVKAEESMSDPYIYIVISNTGSNASELISFFTKKQYNHVSLSFDEDLNTLISYNGGENVYPPGLNLEMIEFFNKKDDASIIVYKINVGKDKKGIMLSKVRQINEEGSAYNLLGLALKISIRPNIMFCSQFVYKLLEHAQVQIFEFDSNNIKPTDFVELDYYRKLEYCYEIVFNDKKC